MHAGERVGSQVRKVVQLRLRAHVVSFESAAPRELLGEKKNNKQKYLLMSRFVLLKIRKSQPDGKTRVCRKNNSIYFVLSSRSVAPNRINAKSAHTLLN